MPLSSTNGVEIAQNDAYHSSNHHKYTAGNPIYQWHLRKVMKRLYEMLSRTRPRTVLDAGCGEGFVTGFLKEQDPTLCITGVDVNEKAVRYARKHFGDRARFRTGTLYALPFPDDTFDTVLCSEVLEHVDDPVRATRELGRVARSYVVISVPREPYFKWLNDLGQWLGLSPDPGHVNFWTKPSFQEFIAHQYDGAAFAWEHIYQFAVAKV